MNYMGQPYPGMYGNGYNNGINSMLPSPAPVQYPYGKQEVITVHGETGVDKFELHTPNSSVLLLDETAPIVWLVTTDGTGYPTKTPYDISPHKSQTEVEKEKVDKSFASLEERISRAKIHIKLLPAQSSPSLLLLSIATSLALRPDSPMMNFSS